MVGVLHTAQRTSTRSLLGRPARAHTSEQYFGSGPIGLGEKVAEHVWQVSDVGLCALGFFDL